MPSDPSGSKPEPPKDRTVNLTGRLELPDLRGEIVDESPEDRRARLELELTRLKADIEHRREEQAARLRNAVKDADARRRRDDVILVAGVLLGVGVVVFCGLMLAGQVNPSAEAWDRAVAVLTPIATFVGGYLIGGRRTGAASLSPVAGD